MSKTSPFAALPRVDRLVAHASLEVPRRRLGLDTVTRLARRAVEEARREVRGGDPCPSLDQVAARVAVLAGALLGARACPVINATGVVLHTNLGRAPLADAAVKALADSAGHYTSLELDLGTGRRGARGAFAETGLAELAGSEAGLVVNNNAAATLLALSALAMGRKVLVSRGELIEIGGGFRVPDVCARSGALLVEVGTTNRTRLSDYERAFDDGGVAAVLQVHPGNFRQTGFVERPAMDTLAALTHARGALLIQDLGGGAVIDLAPDGLEGEPTVRSGVAAGADVVCFSTDKLFGGPQGGALVGRSDTIEKARRDPLARALRMGRLPLVALEATVALYREGRLAEVPALAALRRPIAEVRERARHWHQALAARGVAVQMLELEGAAGGGALAEAPLRSAGVALDGADAEALARRLRAGNPAVMGRIHEGKVLLDARTVLPGEDRAMLEAVVQAVTTGL